MKYRAFISLLGVLFSDEEWHILWYIRLRQTHLSIHCTINATVYHGTCGQKLDMRFWCCDQYISCICCIRRIMWPIQLDWSELNRIIYLLNIFTYGMFKLIKLLCTNDYDIMHRMFISRNNVCIKLLLYHFREWIALTWHVLWMRYAVITTIMHLSRWYGACSTALWYFNVGSEEKNAKFGNVWEPHVQIFERYLCAESGEITLQNYQTIKINPSTYGVCRVRVKIPERLSCTMHI